MEILFSDLNLGGNAEFLRPMYMGEDSFFCLLLREKGDHEVVDEELARLVQTTHLAHSHRGFYDTIQQKARSKCARA